MFVAPRNILGSSIETAELGFTGIEKVAEDITSGGAVTSVSFTGLDLETDKWYRINGHLTNATASSATIYLYANNDTTATNYYEQFLLANNAALSGGRANDPKIGTLKANETMGFDIFITKLASERTVAIVFTTNYDGASLSMYHFVWAWQATTNVTRIDLTSSVASAIGNTSRISICRPTG